MSPVDVRVVASTPDDRRLVADTIADPRFQAAYRGAAGLSGLRAGTTAVTVHPGVRAVPGDVEVVPQRRAGVGCEWLAPPDATGPGTIVYLHGGGFVRGDLALGRANAATIARAAATRVLAIGYRQAPEHPFPAAPDDVAAVLRDLDGDAPYVVLGESSGGTLALAVAVMADRGTVRRPAGLAALSPLADLDLGGASWWYNADRDVATRDTGLAMVRMYLGNGDPHDPLASPIEHHFHGAPPLLIGIGGHETMLSDVEHLARAASRAGASVRLDVYQAMPHGFTRFVAPIADAALEASARWCAERLAAVRPA